MKRDHRPRGNQPLTLERALKGYRRGGTSHGILLFISDVHPRAKEIVELFNTINGSSTLTYLRRKGMIEHSGEANTSPYTLTPLGVEYLSHRGEYTPADYANTQRRGCSPQVLPWRVSFEVNKTLVDSYLKLMFEQAKAPPDAVRHTCENPGCGSLTLEKIVMSDGFDEITIGRCLSCKHEIELDSQDSK